MKNNIKLINKLLKSTIYEDVYLGVLLADKHLGQSWAEKNFVPFKYETKANVDHIGMQKRTIDFTTYGVFIGFAFIEYLKF